MEVLRGRVSLHGFCASRDRLHDVVVAGATAKVAVELVTDGLLVERKFMI